MSVTVKNISYKIFKLHSMDNNQQGYKIILKLGRHKMIVRNRWESCGIIQEIVNCSCGFNSTQHSGGGCWQQGHDKPKSHKRLLGIHKEMYYSMTDYTQSKQETLQQ